MYFVLINLAVLVLTTSFFWWLSGYDSQLTGHNETRDFVRRTFRCGLSLVLVEISFIFLWQYLVRHDPWAGFLYLLSAMPLVLIWCSCGSHLGAHIFEWFIDPHDKRAFHPHLEVRLLDGIAELIRTGKTAEAIRICEALKASGEVSVSTLELTLEHLGVPQKSAKIAKPLTEVDRLRSERNFLEAELILQSLLLKNPRDLEAAMQLMRLYALDLHQPLSAACVLQTLEKQPRMDPAHLDFARRSIAEWSIPRTQPPELPESLPVESADELLARGFIGTAIEMLEEQIKARPQDFELRIKLAEVQAVKCKNFAVAEKIVKKMDGIFTREQVEFAGSRLGAWREGTK